MICKLHQSDIPQLCNELLLRQVHQWGLMRTWYENPEMIDKIAVARNDCDVPIGAAVYLKSTHCGYNISMFVHPAYRRRGIATSLFNELKVTPDDVRCYAGTTESKGFFGSVLGWTK